MWVLELGGSSYIARSPRNFAANDDLEMGVAVHPLVLGVLYGIAPPRDTRSLWISGIGRPRCVDHAQRLP